MSDCHTIDCGYTVTGKVCNCSCGAEDELVPSEAELKAIDLSWLWIAEAHGEVSDV